MLPKLIPHVQLTLTKFTMTPKAFTTKISAIDKKKV